MSRWKTQLNMSIISLKFVFNGGKYTWKDNMELSLDGLMLSLGAKINLKWKILTSNKNWLSYLGRLSIRTVHKEFQAFFLRY